MDKLLLSVVVVSGLCVVLSAAERRYHVVYELKTMTEAQRHCRENYTNLMTVRDQEDVETLKILNMTMDSSKMAASGSRAWIGLYDDSWRWSLSNTSFYGPGETEFRGWKPGHPNNGSGEKRCAVINPDGTWSDSICGFSRRSVCFDVRGPQTFVFIKTLMTWTKAQSYCRQHHTDLTMVRNMEENQKVRMENLSGGAWIGLYSDAWTWSDGSNYSFIYWEHLAPGGHPKTCVAADFSADGQWVDVDCSVKSAFICYSDVPVVTRVMKVRLQKSSSLDLNDPMVMEGLLKQLKQKLKDQGLNDDIKLSWKKQADGKVFHKEEKKTGKKGRDEL